jgi:hypothetical protein
MIVPNDASNQIFFANLAGSATADWCQTLHSGQVSNDGSFKNRPFSKNFYHTISVLVTLRIYIKFYKGYTEFCQYPNLIYKSGWTLRLRSALKLED